MYTYLHMYIHAYVDIHTYTRIHTNLMYVLHIFKQHFCFIFCLINTHSCPLSYHLMSGHHPSEQENIPFNFQFVLYPTHKKKKHFQNPLTWTNMSYVSCWYHVENKNNNKATREGRREPPAAAYHQLHEKQWMFL